MCAEEQGNGLLFLERNDNISLLCISFTYFLAPSFILGNPALPGVSELQSITFCPVPKVQDTQQLGHAGWEDDPWSLRQAEKS